MVSLNVVFLIVTRIIHGIGFALSSTASVALAAEYIPRDKMGEGIGYLGISTVISSTVVPGHWPVFCIKRRCIRAASERGLSL